MIIGYSERNKRKAFENLVFKANISINYHYSNIFNLMKNIKNNDTLILNDIELNLPTEILNNFIKIILEKNINLACLKLNSTILNIKFNKNLYMQNNILIDLLKVTNNHQHDKKQNDNFFKIAFEKAKQLLKTTKEIIYTKKDKVIKFLKKGLSYNEIMQNINISSSYLKNIIRNFNNNIYKKSNEHIKQLAFNF